VRCYSPLSVTLHLFILDSAHTPILKRVGVALITIGGLDIMFMVYCLMTGRSYSSILNLPALIAGIFLFRQNLRAASIVRWWAVFVFAGFATALPMFILVQPFDLTITELVLYPGATLLTVALTVGLLTLTGWMAYQLGREPIHTARDLAGRKRRDMRIPIALGLALSIATAGFSLNMLRGERAEALKAIAAEKLGPDFQYAVSSMQIVKSKNETRVFGMVTAWNVSEIKRIRVSRVEP
jgi:hypothetical protein